MDSTNKYLWRFLDASFPYQTWKPFPPEAIVAVKAYAEDPPTIGPAKSFWWGYSEINPKSVIRYARRLDKPKEPSQPLAPP